MQSYSFGCMPALREELKWPGPKLYFSLPYLLKQSPGTLDFMTSSYLETNQGGNTIQGGTLLSIPFFNIGKLIKGETMDYRQPKEFNI